LQFISLLFIDLKDTARNAATARGDQKEKGVHHSSGYLTAGCGVSKGIITK
jgi:hypothetical protein